MKHYLLLLCLALLCSSHDMFLKLDGYFLKPHAAASVRLFNGTFEASENTIDRNRMTDVSLVAGGQRHALDTTQWREQGYETILDLTTAEAGTYLVGVSTRARNIELDAEAFNGYLEHDGVVDMLERRRTEGALEVDAVEQYSKHVKTLFQVGEERSDDYATELGYPIEFIPLTNPYDLHPGDRLQVKLLRDGRPLPDQLVYAGAATNDHGHDHASDHDHSHESGEGHDHSAGTTQLRTDSEGVLTMDIDGEGTHYLRTIHMVERDDAGLTHESNWATLTFGVGHAHGEGSHTHAHAAGEAHEHNHEAGLPSYIYWVGSLVLVGGLFVYFNRRTA